jgi:O-antigen ligase/tetratricopeptide (TPR) repeat protein
VILLTAVALSPWPFASVHPFFEGLLYLVIAVLVVLWGLRALAEGRLVLVKCPVLLCLAGLYALAVWQTVPWSHETLARLSPGTASLYAGLLPQQPEVLTDAAGAAGETGGSTLSINPGATRQEAVRLLAVLLLFAVVRHNLEPGPALRRLAWVAVVNGTLLTLLGLAQFVSSGPHTIYWVFPSLGTVFGPFISRTHFPFYVNVCVGLGLGLLLAANAHSRGRRSGGGFSPGALLERPVVLWVSVAVAVMAGGVACSLSRGGFLSLLGGLAVALGVQGAVSRRAAGLAVTLLVATLAAGFLAWFGWGAIQARLETVWQTPDPLEEGRVRVWRKVLPRARDFPVWGTGNGTFELVERLCATSRDDPTVTWDHAHNDYLEALIEGGVVRLGLTLAGVFFVLWLGLRACRRLRGHRAGGLAVGALAGFCAVLLHSTVEYGVHMPAIALLTTVVAALLAGLGAEAGRHSATARPPVPLGKVTAFAGLVGAVVVGFVLALEGHRLDRAFRHVTAARWAAKTPGETAARIGHLRAAARWAPADASIPAELANAYAQAFTEENDAGRLRLAVVGALQDVLLAAAGAPPDFAAVGATAARVAWAHRFRDEEAERARRYGQPALEYALRARALCPLLPAPHVRLAAFADLLARGDPPRVYLERAHAVRPVDTEITYLLGLQCFQDGSFAEAWRSWREVLDRSDERLEAIVERSSRVLTPDELADNVLPRQPETLARAAFLLFPGEGDDPRRRALLERALPLFADLPTPLPAKQLYLKARIYELLNQPDEALAAYRAALTREPRQVEWRLEMARLMYRQGRLGEAEEELGQILNDQQGHGGAIALLNQVLRERVKEK